MAKKYYGVKKGHNTGVYDNWAECQKQINGFSGADYKGFSTKEEAEAFVYGAVNPTVTSTNEVDDNYNKSAVIENNYDTSEYIEVYVDGSFREELRSIGYGVVFVKNDEPIFRDCGRVPTNDLTERNVTGEIYATIRTIQMCIANGFNKIILCYDYQGLEKWATGSWKAKKPLTQRYVEYYHHYTTEKGLDIKFKHTPSHTGIKWNDEADRLAKLGCEL